MRAEIVHFDYIIVCAFAILQVSFRKDVFFHFNQLLPYVGIQ
jgi:hypothetical protein